MKLNKYGTFDEGTEEQILQIASSKAFVGQNIAIMPDAHKGKGACVGFTATFDDMIIPNVVGVDVGCGMTMAELPKHFTKNRLKELQQVIRVYIPYGMNRHNNLSMRQHAKTKLVPFLHNLTFKLTQKQEEGVLDSLGSLGGGNHFIEVNENSEGKLFLVIHSGSRSLGTIVASRHQKIAEQNFVISKPTKEQIANWVPEKRAYMIKQHSKSLIDDKPLKGLEYLVGDQTQNYLNDMAIAQEYAKQNRERMIRIIFNMLSLHMKPIEYKHTIHNWVDVKNKIIRKGSVYADPNNDIIIPLNMRDGSIIARGLKNKDANYSAPHGAGRLMSRMQANAEVNLDDFKETMKDVVSWTVNENTLDEAPFAYKTKEFILENLKELVEVKEIIKPVFNFKDDSPMKKWAKKKIKDKGAKNE